MERGFIKRNLVLNNSHIKKLIDKKNLMFFLNT